MQTSEKTCFKCGQAKLLDEFYKHPQMADGHLNKCKDCARMDVQKNRACRIAYYREYDRNRGSRLTAEDLRRYRNTNPEKYLAHRMVSNSLRDGKIHKQPCAICGSKTVHAHHPDYSKPLEVVWLCPEHHSSVHKHKLQHPRSQSPVEEPA